MFSSRMYSYARVWYSLVEPSTVSVNLRQAEIISIFKGRVIKLSRDLVFIFVDSIFCLSVINWHSQAYGWPRLRVIIAWIHTSFRIFRVLLHTTT